MYVVFIKLILKIVIKIQGKGGIPKTGTVQIRGKLFSEIQGEINFTNIFCLSFDCTFLV